MASFNITPTHIHHPALDNGIPILVENYHILPHARDIGLVFKEPGIHPPLPEGFEVDALLFGQTGTFEPPFSSILYEERG